jgi:hypothetical protein
MPINDEMKWEGRIWTVLQVTLVSLVGWLTLDAINNRSIIAQTLVEHRYTNVRLEKIEATLERGIDDRYRGQDARRDWEAQALRDKAQDDRMNAQASAIQDLRNRVGK